MKKGKKIIIVVGLTLAVALFMVGIYFYGLSAVSKDDTPISFTITSGTNKKVIVDKLKEAKLIKSKISLYIYIALNKDLNLQAGTYELKANMNAKEILDIINAGAVKENNSKTYKLTFIEGKKLNNYAKIIAKNTNTSEEEVMSILNDPEYLQELISKYWFLTENILDSKIYYPLEGYLFPNTYEFYATSTPKDIIEKMLNSTASVLEDLKESITNSGYSVHEILTMASIVESEGANSDDRAGVAGVFYNRLKRGESLGSDVTTYYGAKVELSERDLYQAEIDDCSNGYNTRGLCNWGKLPVGPINNPSLDSIKASLNPSNHDYLFFVADKNKKTYFTKTNSEHDAKVRELKAAGLWYTYN